MPIVLADVGADQILKAYFNDAWPVSKNLKLRLFTNDYTPLDTSVLGDFIEAVGGGYTPMDLNNGSWVITVGHDPSDAEYAQQTFPFTGPLTGPATIYGYYIEDNGGSTGTLVWAERIGASFEPLNNGDELKITPKFQLSKGTPTA